MEAKLKELLKVEKQVDDRALSELGGKCTAWSTLVGLSEVGVWSWAVKAGWKWIGVVVVASANLEA